jgi:hypothetical protein
VVSGLPQVNAGKLRALAVSSGKRAQVAPNVPTVAESGFPGYDVRGWYGIVAPAKTPAAIINRLNTEIVAILRSPAATERLAFDGSEAVGSTPEEFRRAHQIRNDEVGTGGEGRRHHHRLKIAVHRTHQNCEALRNFRRASGSSHRRRLQIVTLPRRTAGEKAPASSYCCRKLHR